MNTLPVPATPLLTATRRRPRGRFRVVGRVHPFRAETFERSYDFGTTLGDVLDDLKFPRAAGGVYVWLQGEPVPPAYLDRIKPKPGVTVNFNAVPGGGNIVGLDTIRLAAFALVNLAGAAVGALAGGPLGVILPAAIGFLGMLAVNALIPPPRTELDAMGYSVSGYRNEIAKYRVIPVVFGRFKCYPPMLEPYSTIDEFGNESIHMLLIVGHGPITISDVRAGDTPISEIAGAQMAIHEGIDATDPELSIYPSDVDQDAVNVELSLDGYVADDAVVPNNWVTRTTDLGTDRISVDLLFPDGLGRQDSGGGGLKGWRTGLQIQYRPVGFYTWRNMAPNLAALLSATAEELYDSGAEYPDIGQWADLDALATLLQEQIAELETAFGTLEDVVATQQQRDQLIQELGEILDRIVEMGEAPPTYTTLQGDVITIVTPFVSVVTNFWGIVSNQWGLGDTAPSEIIDRIAFVVNQILALININRYTTQGNGPSLETFPLLWRFIVNRRGLGPLFGDPIEGAFVIADKRLTPVRRSVAWPVPPGQYEVRARRVGLGDRGIFNDWRQALDPQLLINLDGTAGDVNDGVARVVTGDMENAERDRYYFQIGGRYVVSGANTLTVTLQVEHAANDDFSDVSTLFISTVVYNNTVEPIVKLGFGDEVSAFNRYVRVTATISFSAPDTDTFDGQLELFQTGNTTDEEIFEKPWWSALRSIKRNVAPISEPNVAKIELRLPVGPQVNNVVNQINCIATARLPVLLEDTPLDAPYTEWPVQETRNPAWAYQSVLCKAGPNKRPLTASRLHIDELLEWAENCRTEEINFHGVNVPAISTVVNEGDPENGSPVYSEAVSRAAFDPAVNDRVRLTVDLRIALTDGQACDIEIAIETDADDEFPDPVEVVSETLDTITADGDTIINRRMEITSGNVFMFEFVRARVTATMAGGIGDGSVTVVAVLKIGRFEGRTFDAYITDPTTVFQMLRDIAACGRAAFSLIDSRYSVVEDRPQTVPVQMFTPRNSSGFKIYRNLLPMPEGVKVRFNDPDHDFQIAEVIVPADGFDAAGITGPVPNAIDVLPLLGCTQPEQAYADGRYYLAAFELRRESYTINVDWEYLIARRGKLCLLAHDVALWGLVYPRLLAVEGDPITTVVFDSPALFSTAAAPYDVEEVIDDITIVHGDAADGLAYESNPADYTAGRALQTFVTMGFFSIEAGETMEVRTRILTDDNSGFTSPSLVADRTDTYEGPMQSAVEISMGWAEAAKADLESDTKVEVTITFGGTGAGYFQRRTIRTGHAERFAVRLRMNDATFHVGDVFAEPQDSRRVRLQLPLTEGTLPLPGDMAAFGISQRETIEAVLKEVRPVDDLGATLTFVPHAPEIHDAATEPIPDFDPRITTPPVANQAAPPVPIIRDFPAGHPRAGQDMVISDESALVLLPDGSFQPRIVISLERPASTFGQKEAAWFEGHIRPHVADDENPWDQLPFIPVDQTEMVFGSVLEQVSYDLRIRTVSADGRASAWLYILDHLVTGKTNPPPDVTQLFFENGDTVRWNYDAPIDWAGFRVRYARDPDTAWGAAISMVELSPANSITPVPAGTSTIMVKAVDTSGNESNTEGRITVTRDLSASGNVVEEISASDSGTWPAAGDPLAGRFFVNQLGQLEADQRIRGEVDLTTFRARRIRGDVAVATFRAQRIADYPASYAPWFSGLLLAAFNGEDVPYTPSVLYHEIDLHQGEAVAAYSADGGSAVTTLPPQLAVEHADIDYLFALIMTGDRRPVLNDAVLIFDVNDVAEIIEGVTIAPGGTRLTLTKAYNRIKVVTAGVDAGGSAVGYTIADYQADPGPEGGPLVHLVDGSGSSVGGTATFYVQGY